MRWRNTVYLSKFSTLYARGLINAFFENNRLINILHYHREERINYIMCIFILFHRMSIKETRQFLFKDKFTYKYIKLYVPTHFNQSLSKYNTRTN